MGYFCQSDQGNVTGVLSPCLPSVTPRNCHRCFVSLSSISHTKEMSLVFVSLSSNSQIKEPSQVFCFPHKCFVSLSSINHTKEMSLVFSSLTSINQTQKLSQVFCFPVQHQSKKGIVTGVLLNQVIPVHPASLQGL